MAIYLNSRYSTAVVSTATLASGVVTPVVYRGASPITVAPSTSNSYTSQEGDRLDSVAYAIYGDASYYWIIADANPGITLDPLPSGLRLVIPNVIG